MHYSDRGQWRTRGRGGSGSSGGAVDTQYYTNDALTVLLHSDDATTMIYTTE